MSKSENRQDSGGNDDDPQRQILRSEKNWRELLKHAESETARFLKIYTEALCGGNARAEENAPDYDRLDACAIEMGWHLGAKNADEEESDEAEDDGNDLEKSAADFPSVYSLHNLPECIAIDALFKFTKLRLAKIFEIADEKISARTAAALVNFLANAQHDMMLAIEAEDALEFGLAICLMKNAHGALNGFFSAAEKLPNATDEKNYVCCTRELRSAVLDLRDICLRVIRDSRTEMQNRGN